MIFKQIDDFKPLLKKAVKEARGRNVTEKSTIMEIYRTIKDILRPENLAKNSLKVQDGKVLIEDPEALAETFNDFFVKKPGNLAKKNQEAN